MDAQKFEAIAKAAVSRNELETLKKNALSRGQRDLAAIVEHELQARFPQKPRKRGGPTPTAAAVCGESKEFGSGKEAYIWLVERLRDQRDGLLDLYCERRSQMSEHGGRRYFAKTPSDLFGSDSDLVCRSGTNERLKGGWFADINLSHAQKFKVIVQLAALADLSYPDDVDFRVVGATESLVEKQSRVKLAEQLLSQISGSR